MKIVLILLLGFSLFVLIAFAVLGKKSRTGHAIGLVDGVLAPCPNSPNCVCSENGTDAKHAVLPYANTDWQRLISVIEAMPNAKIITNKNGYLAAEFQSKTFGFVDDFEARADGDVIQVRSASRVGYGDGGVNRARVENIRALLNTKRLGVGDE